MSSLLLWRGVVVVCLHQREQASEREFWADDDVRVLLFIAKIVHMQMQRCCNVCLPTIRALYILAYVLRRWWGRRGETGQVWMDKHLLYQLPLITVIKCIVDTIAIAPSLSLLEQYYYRILGDSRQLDNTSQSMQCPSTPGPTQPGNISYCAHVQM